MSRALIIAEANVMDQVLVADVRYALARILPNRKRAQMLARAAEKTYQGASEKLADLKQWLASQ